MDKKDVKSKRHKGSSLKNGIWSLIFTAFSYISGITNLLTKPLLLAAIVMGALLFIGFMLTWGMGVMMLITELPEIIGAICFIIYVVVIILIVVSILLLLVGNELVPPMWSLFALISSMFTLIKSHRIRKDDALEPLHKKARSAAIMGWIGLGLSAVAFVVFTLISAVVIALLLGMFFIFFFNGNY